jgi:hypothetical protein
MDRIMTVRSCSILIVFVCAGFIVSAQAPRPANPLGNGPDVIQAGRGLFNKTCTGVAMESTAVRAAGGLHWPASGDSFA